MTFWNVQYKKFEVHGNTNINCIFIFMVIENVRFLDVLLRNTKIRRCGGQGKEVWWSTKEVSWSRGGVPATGPPGPGSNLGPGPPHSVV